MSKWKTFVPIIAVCLIVCFLSVFTWRTLVKRNLFKGILSNDIVMVENSIKWGADVNGERFSYPWCNLFETNDTPLTLACKLGNEEIVRALLLHGADVNLKESWGGDDPLSAALRGAVENRYHLAMLLIKHGAEVHKEIKMNTITDNPDENILVSDTFDFAQVENAVIIPEIIEVEPGEYIICISAYSETGTEKLIVKSIILKKDTGVLLNRAFNREIQLEQNPDGMYEGWVDGDSFPARRIELADGEKYDMLVQVESETDGVTLSKEIAFELVG